MTDTEFKSTLEGEDRHFFGPLLKELRAVLDVALCFEDKQSLLKKQMDLVNDKLCECATRITRLRSLLEAYGVDDSAIVKAHLDKRRARDTTAEEGEAEEGE